MSVYRSKNSPYFQYDFVVGGARFHGSTHTKDRRKAQAYEAALRTQAAQGGAVRRKPRMSIDTAAQRFWTEKAQFEANHKTVEYQLANLVEGIDQDGSGRNVLLSDITNGKVATYVARRRATLSNRSVNCEVELLRRLMRRADKIWRVDVGEMPAWGQLLLDEPDERVRELTAAEDTALFANLRQDFHPLVRFALMSGIRLSNLIGLTWRQVDFDAAELRLMVKSRKPGGKVLVVPMTAPMTALLSAERGKHEAHVFTYECARSRGKRRTGQRHPFTQSGWRKPWRAALDAAGVTDFRFHDTRHTAATRTLRAGNLKIVQRMLGHSRIETTAKYAHAMVEDVRAAMAVAQSRNIPEVAAAENAKPLNRKVKA